MQFDYEIASSSFDTRVRDSNNNRYLFYTFSQIIAINWHNNTRALNEQREKKSCEKFSVRSAVIEKKIHPIFFKTHFQRL